MTKTIHPLRRFAPRPACLRGTTYIENGLALAGEAKVNNKDENGKLILGE